MPHTKQPLIPPDQFDRVVQEMRRFSNLLDEQERNLTMSRGIDTVEARRCFAHSAMRLQEAGFWFEQALTYARAAAKQFDKTIK